MTKDYEELWDGVTNAANEAQAVRTLAEILTDKEGRVFISRLGSKDAELCIEVLDRVSHGLHFPFRHSDVLFRVSQSRTSKPLRNKHSSSP